MIVNKLIYQTSSGYNTNEIEGSPLTLFDRFEELTGNDTTVFAVLLSCEYPEGGEKLYLWKVVQSFVSTNTKVRIPL